MEKHKWKSETINDKFNVFFQHYYNFIEYINEIDYMLEYIPENEKNKLSESNLGYFTNLLNPSLLSDQSIIFSEIIRNIKSGNHRTYSIQSLDLFVTLTNIFNKVINKMKEMGEKDISSGLEKILCDDKLFEISIKSYHSPDSNITTQITTKMHSLRNAIHHPEEIFNFNGYAKKTKVLSLSEFEHNEYGEGILLELKKNVLDSNAHMFYVRSETIVIILMTLISRLSWFFDDFVFNKRDEIQKKEWTTT